MNIPLPSEKIDQHNFKDYKDLRLWLYQNNFKSKGMVMEEPWKEYFVERFEKEGFVALTMNITYLPQNFSLPFELWDKPFQVDIAKV